MQPSCIMVSLATALKLGVALTKSSSFDAAKLPEKGKTMASTDGFLPQRQQAVLHTVAVATCCCQGTFAHEVKVQHTWML